MTRIPPDPRACMLLLGLLMACAPSQPASVAASPEPAPVIPAVRTDSTAIAQARADSARYPYTDADVRFMTGMVGHHAQAITMSRLAPSRDASPAVQRLAARIINAQVDEIVTMHQWLADRQKPMPPVAFDGAHVHHAMMPGMLTEAQMRELEAARGPEFDRLFLRYMIQHHKGAVQMVKELFGSYGAGQDEVVFKFASDVNVDQATEIARMELMLEALSPSPQAPQLRNQR